MTRALVALKGVLHLEVAHRETFVYIFPSFLAFTKTQPESAIPMFALDRNPSCKVCKGQTSCVLKSQYYAVKPERCTLLSSMIFSRKRDARQIGLMQMLYAHKIGPLGAGATLKCMLG